MSEEATTPEEETEDEFVPYIAGYRPLNPDESRDLVLATLAAHGLKLVEGIRLESLKSAANDVKMEAHRWAAEALLPELADTIRGLDFREPFWMIEDGIIEIQGNRINVKWTPPEPIKVEEVEESPDGELGQTISSAHFSVEETPLAEETPREKIERLRSESEKLEKEHNSHVTRLTPEFVGEPNERVAIDTIAETVTVLDNPNIADAPDQAAPAPFAPQLDSPAAEPTTKAKRKKAS